MALFDVTVASRPHVHSSPSIGTSRPRRVLRATLHALRHPATIALACLLLVWEMGVRLAGLPTWWLPAPSVILDAFGDRWTFILNDAAVTVTSTVVGLALGIAVGVALALAMSASRLLARALGPLAVVSQAIPFMALAPLLMIWLGFGMASKIAMVTIVIFFTVAVGFHEGMKRADEQLLDLARLYGASHRQMLWLIRVPSALPQFAASVKIAAAFAPLGAIAGEWVGSEGGLGIAMTYHNARMQTELVFANMLVIIAVSLVLWLAIDALSRHLLRHYPDTLDR